MKIIKRFSFWFVLFALMVCLYNVMGFDDKNLLLFFTTPPFWLLEDFTPQLKLFFVNENIFRVFLYLVNIAFWFLFGLLLDWIANRKKIQNL
jgi:hypothetical protein